MRNKLILFVFVALIVGLAGGYWAGKRRIPPGGSERAATSEGTRQTGVLGPGNLAPASGSASFPGQAAIERKRKQFRSTPPEPQGSDGKVRSYNLADPQGRQEFARAMRQQGVAEQEIQHLLKEAEEAAEKAVRQENKEAPSSKGPPPPSENQKEPQTYNLADPQRRQEFARAMRQQGIPEEEIQQILKGAAEATEKAKVQESKEVPSSASGRGQRD